MNKIWRITIITATYNCADTLEQTILSVINQTYKDIEYIIIDGGSTDGTIEIIKKYQHLITKWVSEPDQGIYDALNKGINLSTGDYIQILGSDDSLINDSIIYDIVKTINDDIDILSAPVWVIDESHKLQRLKENRRSKTMIMAGRMIPHQGVFVRSSLMQQFLFDVKYKIASDYNFILKAVMENKRLEFVDFPVAYYSNGGKSSVNKCESAEEYNIIMLQNNIDKDLIERFNCRIKSERRLFALKNFIRSICQFFCVYKILLRMKGWEVHKCSNQKCRWCK